MIESNRALGDIINPRSQLLNLFCRSARDEIGIAELGFEFCGLLLQLFLFAPQPRALLLEINQTFERTKRCKATLEFCR